MIKDFFLLLKRYSVISILVSAFAGIFMVIYPEQSIQYVSLIAGIALILFGAAGIISYVIKKDNSFLLMLGVIVAIVGIIICFKYRVIVSVIELIFGIFILVSGIMDLAASINAVCEKSKSAVITLIMSLVSIVFGIVAVTRPFDMSKTLVRFIGAGLLFYAVQDLISFFQYRKIASRIQEIDSDAVMIEEDDDDQ